MKEHFGDRTREQREKKEREGRDRKESNGFAKEDLISALMHRSIMSRDDRIEIRSVRRVHAAPGLKTETDGDRVLGQTEEDRTGGVGGRSFWRQVLDGRERLLPARPYEMPRRIPADTAHTRSLFRSRREYARVRKRVPTDASREPLQSTSGKSQSYSEGPEF